MNMPRIVIRAAAVVAIAALTACQPATPGEQTTPIATIAQINNSLQVRTTPSLISVEGSGNWSASVRLDVTGGQPPYTIETTWPAAGEATYTVSATDCKPVRFNALVKSADGLQHAIDLQFGPSACQSAAAAPTPTPQPDSGAATGTPAPTLAASAPAATTSGASSEAADLLNRINAVRAQNSLPPYTLNDQLVAAAQRHSQDMANTGNISHAGSDGSTARDRILATGYAAVATAEGIYAGASLDDAWNFWSTDPDHRPSLLSAQYKEIGLGVVKGASLTYFTVTFGAR
jgi:uncharacterized protein YkwD